MAKKSVGVKTTISRKPVAVAKRAAPVRERKQPLPRKMVRPPARGRRGKPETGAAAKMVQPVENDPVRESNIEKNRKWHELLLRLRRQVAGQINFLATDNLSRKEGESELDFRSEEAGTDNFDRDFALNRVSADQETIFEIDEAINRIEMGVFGRCEVCEKAIEKQRLRAIPHARMCLSCKSNMESGRRRFRAFDSNAAFPGTEVVTEPGGDDS